MSLRVLIAEPDASLRDTYGSFFGARGFVVSTAASGLECVASLRKRTPDALVLAAELPWGSGDGVLALMQEGTDVPAVPVVITISTRRPVADLVAHFADYAVMLRPIPPVVLATVVRSLAAQARQYRTTERTRQPTDQSGRKQERYDESGVWI